MKLTAQKILGACAVAWAAAATGAPLEAGLGINGNLRVGGKGAQMALSIHHEGWNGTSTGVRSDFTFPDKATGTAQFELFHEKDRCGHGSATLLPTTDGRAVYVVTATSEADLNPEATVLSLTLPCGTWTGGTWTDASGKKHTFPKEFAAERMCLYSATVKSISFAAAGNAEPFTLSFPRPVPVMIQDDRK